MLSECGRSGSWSALALCYAPATLHTDPDLVALWAFDPGTSVVDTTGNAATVALGPGATFAAGAPDRGTGVLFDGGSGGFIDVGLDPAIANLGPMTVAAWIEPNQTTLDNIKTIVTKGPPNGSVGAGCSGSTGAIAPASRSRASRTE